jgi:thiamine pyrophosphate-dependent acetolactate synthase large subunit-like protein
VVVQCDVDPGAFGRHGLSPTHAVVGDARLAAEGLLERLRTSNGAGNGGGARGDARPSSGFRTPEAAAALAAARRDAGRQEPYDDGTLDPAAVCARLDDLLPAERVLVTDGGHSILYAVDHVGVPDPRALVHSIDFGATGAGLGSAIGAALGRPDHVTALFIGDGAC